MKKQQPITHPTPITCSMRKSTACAFVFLFIVGTVSSFCFWKGKLPLQQQGIYGGQKYGYGHGVFRNVPLHGFIQNRRRADGTKLYDGPSTATQEVVVESIPVFESSSLEDNYDATKDEIEIEVGVNGSFENSADIKNKDEIEISNSTNGPEHSIALTGDMDENDVPRPTKNGGFTHTSSSRAKISAANKGKTPWNKGKARSEETKARIREGVLRRVREKHLQKLKDLGITEEEWEAEQSRIKAEKAKRKTAKGGYKPTEKTKKIISDRLKEKWANGEVKPRVKKKMDPNYVNPRKGVKQSEETKAKIRDALKAKWEDPEYREKMLRANTKNKAPQNRKQISETLKKKWEDPDFRAKMMEKIKARKTNSSVQSLDHREKISEAMKKKWQDPEYRTKTIKGIKEYNKSRPTSTSSRAAKPRPKKKKVVSLDEVAGKPKQRKKRAKKKIATIEPPEEATDASRQGSISRGNDNEDESERMVRMKEENNDLYDLLYGDDNLMAKGSADTNLRFLNDDDDEDLENFDPYGLKEI